MLPTDSGTSLTLALDDAEADGIGDNVEADGIDDDDYYCESFVIPSD